MDFTDLVRRMRNAQKDYFRYRKQATLILAKQLEKEVDDLLASQENLHGDLGSKGGMIDDN